MKWNIKKPNILKVAAYKKRLGISSIFAKVLLNRNIKIDTADKILHDPMMLIEDPYKIAGAEEVARAIIKLLDEKKEFFVFADYDVDGLTSGFIMTDFLRSIGAKASVYYPERYEGYGLNMKFCKEAVQFQGIIITVDNGITKNAEIEWTKRCGTPIVVTDHHEPQGKLPDCPCCDPYISESSAGHHLCGAAVAWKVCMIIEDILGKGDTEKYLPYIALGTIADVMPMTPENAALVNLGLEAVNQGKSRAIKALMNACDIKSLTAEDIAWKIAPKLNACGRMNDIMAAGELFFMEDASDEELHDQILEIVERDDARQKATKKAQKEIEKLDFSNDMVCLFDASDYPMGISGIIAGKIAEHFGKPAFVYFDDGSDIVSASARSINGLDLPQLLDNERSKGSIVNWGGHALACGVTFKLDKVNEFREGMNRQIGFMLEHDMLKIKESELDIDTEIGFKDIADKLMKELEELPYDKAVCTSPEFCLKNVKVQTRQPYSNKNHLVLDCIDKDGTKFTLVEWNGYPAYEALGKPKAIDIAGRISTVGFQDRTTKRKAQDVTIRIDDMRAATKGE